MGGSRGTNELEGRQHLPRELMENYANSEEAEVDEHKDMAKNIENNPDNARTVRTEANKLINYSDEMLNSLNVNLQSDSIIHMERVKDMSKELLTSARLVGQNPSAENIRTVTSLAQNVQQQLELAKKDL